MADDINQLLIEMSQPGYTMPAAPSTSSGDLFADAFHDIDREAEKTAIYREAYERNQGGTSREFEAGWEQAVGLTARTVGEVADWDAAREYSEDRMTEAAGLSAKSGFTQTRAEIDGIGSAASFGAKQLLNTIPQAGTMLATAGAGVLTGHVGLGLAAAAATNWAQQTGGNLDAQIEEGKEIDLTAAALGGVAQTTLDLAAGVGGRVLGIAGVGLRKAGTEAVEKAATRSGRMWQGRPGAILRTSAEEGVTEAMQQGIEEAQRAHGSENYDMLAGKERVIDAGVAGAFVGSAFGGVLGDNYRARQGAPTPSAQNTRQTDEAPTTESGTPASATLAVEDLRLQRRPTDESVVTPGSTPSDIFTGATPETFRPIDQGSVVRVIRGDGPVTAFNAELSTRVHRALSKQDPASAATYIAEEADKLSSRDNTFSESDVANRMASLNRAAELVDMYGRLRKDRAQPAVGQLGVFQVTSQGVIPINDGSNLRAMFGNQKLAKRQASETVRTISALNAGTLDIDTVLASTQRSFENASNGGARAAFEQKLNILTDYKAVAIEAIAQREQALRPVPAPAPAASLAVTPDMLRAQEQAIAQAQVPQQQAAAAQAQEQAVAQQVQAVEVTRGNLLREALTSPKYVGKRASAFQAMLTKNAKTLGPPLVSAGESTLLDNAMSSDVVGEAVADTMSNPKLLEPISAPVGKPNKIQLAARARQDAAAGGDLAQKSQLKSLLTDFTARMDGLQALPEFAKQFGAQFDRLMSNMESIVDNSSKTIAQRITDAQQIIAAVKAAESFAKAPEGTQATLPGMERTARAPVIEPAAQPEATADPAVQTGLFTDDGKPTPEAQGFTKGSITKRLTDMGKAKDTVVPRKKKLAVGSLLRHINRSEGYDAQALGDLVDYIGFGSVTAEDALEQVDRFLEGQEAGRAKAAPAIKAEPVSEPDIDETPDDSSQAPSLVEDARANRTSTMYRKMLNDVRIVPEQSVAHQRTKQIIAEATEGWTGLPDVVVVDPTAPLNADERYGAQLYYSAKVRNPNAEMLGQLNVAPGGRSVIYVFATARNAGRNAVATLFHEALGHYGLRAAYGDQLGKILQQIHANSPAFARDVDEFISDPNNGYDYLDPSDPRTIADAAEELLSQGAEQGPVYRVPGLIQRMKYVLENFARRMGWSWFYKTKGYTDADINAILAHAQYRVLDAKRNTGNVVASSFNEDRFGGPRSMANSLASVARAMESADALDTYLHKRGVNPYVANKAVSILDAVKRGNLGAMLGKTLVDYADRLGISDYRRVSEIQQEQRQIINTRYKQIDQLIGEALRLDPTRGAVLTAKTPRQDALKTYMKTATRKGAWGYQPSWRTDAVQIDTEARKIADDYKKVDPEGWTIADKMLQFASDERAALQTAVRKHIQGEADADLKKALTPSEIKDIQARRARQLGLFDKSVPKFDGPYFPLGRFGNFATVARSKEMIAAEATKDPDKINDLRADAKHFAVFFADSLGDAKQRQNELMALPAFTGGQVTYSTRTKTFEQMGESPLIQMQRLNQMVKSEIANGDIASEAAKQIESLLKDLYVRSLADNSARKYDRRRENIEGADNNMLRAFTEKMRADANSLGLISTYDREVAVTKSMTDFINDNATDPNYVDRKEFLAEVLRRRAVIQAHYDSPWNAIQDKLMAVSSIYHLATSPRYYLLNATQPVMFTAPKIGGRHGLMQAWRSMGEVYSELWPQMKSAAFWKGEIDFTKLKLSKDDIAFLKNAQSQGKLDFGAQLDAGFWEGEVGIGRGLREANHIFRTASSQVEFINRTVAGLSAYRLELAKGRDSDAAMRYGRDIIDSTQFNYATENQPRYFNMLPKVMTQFRKYQVGQIALQGQLIKNLWEAGRTKGMSSAEFKETGRALAYMFAQLGVVAGAMGLPGAQVVGVVGSAIFGSDNEPVNGERWMRQLFGDGMGEYALRGVPSVLGLEMEGVGLGKILNPLPYFDYGSLDTRDGVRDFAFQAGLGAFGGMLDNVTRPLASGEVIDTATAVLPSGLRNAIKAYEMATKGIERKNGDRLLTPDEIGTVQTFLQGLGFRSPNAAQKMTKYYEEKQFAQYYKDRTSEMKRGWVEAVETNDTARLREIEAEWRAVQLAKVGLGMRPAPLSELIRAKQEQEKRQREIAQPPVGFR